MEPLAAKTLVKNTFEHPFDKARFIIFIKNLLNKIDESKAFHVHGDVKESFSNIIKTYERIGSYNSPNGEIIDIIIVYLQKTYSIHHARVTQRNYAARYLADRGQKDAGLFAFISPDEIDWRFSLVKMDYKFEETPSGKIKAKEEFTPARRWSFLVGSNEASHTAQSRFMHLLKDDEHNPTLAQLEDAFNIETVTKEFFLHYRDLFIRTKECLDKVIKNDSCIKIDLEAKGVNTVDFAKKLLGQIVFLYFLQRKGWFGVARDANWGTGAKQFLRELFEKKHGDYKNFFNDILEPLFYEALRIGEERKQDDYYYSRFNCKIPFLNGGLFDPIGKDGGYNWVKTDICLPDNLFSNKDKTKEGDIGTGILDIFDRYNFTVKEDEPLEKEVAIDPELLGKTYEKFNAIRPDNFEEYKKSLKSGNKGEESKFNKQFGVYYTPREIVHYMCQQSLINYLATEFDGRVTKKDIETLIHCGEQVGENDAQVIAKGKETQTYSFKLPEGIRSNAELIDNNLRDIAVCDPAVGSGAFPVGMMSEIVKARNVLSTFITNKNNRKPYDFKRQCIEHSLYGVDIDLGAVEVSKLRLWLSLVVDEYDIKYIKPLPNLDYKIMQGNSLIELLTTESLVISTDSKRMKLVKELKEIKERLFDITIPSQKEILRRKIDVLVKQLFEHDRDKKITELKERISAVHSQQRLFEDERDKKEDKNNIKDIEDRIDAIRRIDIPGPAEHFEWHINYSEIFQDKGGFDVVIANPPYIDSERMVGQGHLELRKAIANTYNLTKGNWDIYIAFFEKGFCLLNQNGILTYITPDKWISKPFGDALRLEKISNLLAILRAGRNVFEDAKVDAIVSVFSNKINESLNVYLYNKDIYLKDTIAKSTLHAPYALDKLFSSSLDMLIRIDNIGTTFSDEFTCENACATSDAYKLKPFIIEHHKCVFNPKTQLKVINTGTIAKYFSKWGLQPMTYLGNKYMSPIVKQDIFLKYFKNAYSKKILRPKVIIKGLNLLDSCLDQTGNIIPGKTTLVVTSKNDDIDNLKYILAIINSSLMHYYIKEKYSSFSYNQGITFTTEMINNFPLVGLGKQQHIVNLVDSILATRLKGKTTLKLENQIDQIVYTLYGLTEEEIKVVEGENKKD